jgi:hypothetical protein
MFKFKSIKGDELLEDSISTTIIKYMTFYINIKIKLFFKEGDTLY